VQTLFLKCLLIEFLKENARWQIWQKKDFFCVCFHMWVFRWSFLVKDILQFFFRHGYDFSWVCILMWRFKFLYVEKGFLQKWHTFSFEDGLSISFFWFSLHSDLELYLDKSLNSHQILPQHEMYRLYAMEVFRCMGPSITDVEIF
jgi:hypothetical protein